MNITLFSGVNCAPCKQVKELLDTNNVKYDELVAQDHAKLAVLYTVRKAPTLVFTQSPIDPASKEKQEEIKPRIQGFDFAQIKELIG